MKKINILLVSLISIITLGSCSNYNSIDNLSSEDLPVTISPSEVYKYYVSMQEELNSILKQKGELNYNRRKTNEKVTELYNSYWKTYTETLKQVQNKLQLDEVKDYFISQIGEEETTYLISIDTSKIFYNRQVTVIDENEVKVTYDEINSKIDAKESFSNVISSFNSYTSYFYPAYNNSLLMRIYNDLYTDNEEYYNSYYANVDIYTSIQENVNKFYKTMLSNDYYKNTTIEYFSFSDNEVQYYLNLDTGDEEEPSEYKSLQDQENELLKTYNAERYKENVDYSTINQIYLDLVKVRRKIASYLGYSSYEEYRFKYYQRDYSVSDAKELFESIAHSSLHSTFNSSSINTGILTSTRIGDQELLDALDYVINVVPSAKSIIKDFKTYGRYNFDVRTNKYSGSYETPISTSKNDYFILLNADGNLEDYSSLYHEFGHYLASLLAEPSYKGKLSQNLDVAEMHSQSLELLMSDYFTSFMDQNSASSLTKYTIFNKLWSILSGVTVASFEDYVYNVATEEELTLDNIQAKFNELCSTYIYPRTFMKDNKGNNIYSCIHHIFASPCYYISYAVSAIPSLEIQFNEDRSNAYYQYNELLKYGETNSFKYVINQLNLASPFEQETINKIASSVKSIFSK